MACALEDLHNWPGEVVISPSDPGDCDWAAALLKRSVTVVAQNEGNLGERINHLDKSLKKAGHAQTIYIGSDAPLLGENEYQQMITALSDYEIVFCPALDGGVTMMANKPCWPDLADLGWSTPVLAQQLKSVCRDHQLTVHCIKASYDLDDSQQLSQLAEDLQQDSRAARQKLLQQINKTNRSPE